MHCIVCENDLSTNNYAFAEGAFFCLPCFFEQHLHYNITQTSCESCGALPSFSHTTPSVSKKTNQKCEVCYDQKPSRDFCPIPSHRCRQINRTICNECIYSHIQQSFENVCTNNVRCSELNCGIKYEYNTIKAILYSNNDIKLFQRYDQFISRNQLEEMDEFLWCSNPECSVGQLNDGGELNNIVTCMRCSQKTCFTHQIPWHQGLTCEEYDSMTDINLQADLKWLTQNTKQCLKSDFNRIRKDGNHRHDSICKHYAAYDKN